MAEDKAVKEKVLGPYSNLKDHSVNYGGGVVGPSAKDVSEVNSFVSDEEGGVSPKVAVGAAVAAGVVGVGGYIVTHQEAPSPLPITRPAETSSSPTVVSTPTGKVEVTISPAPATASPEVKKETVPCTILSPELCSQGELLHVKTSAGDTVTVIGFKLNPGDQLFAPINGEIAKSRLAATSSFKGFYGNMFDAQGVSYNFRGDIQFTNMNTEKVQSGALIGVIANTGTTNLDGYNLIVNIDKFNPETKKYTAAEDILKTLFPNSFTKPAIEKNLQGGAPGSTTIIHTTSSPRP